MRRQSRKEEDPENSFWNKLDSDIDEIGKRAKDNLKKYQLQQNKTKPSPVIRKSKTIVIDIPKNSQFLADEKLNRTNIFKEKRKQEEKQKQMKNRLAYLHHEKQKKHQTIQQAKRKYEQLVSIRNKSFREKQSLKKRRTSFMIQSKEIVREKAQSVRSARKIREQSVKNCQKLLQKSAQRVREERKSNESFIKKEKVMFFNENKNKAHRTKLSLQSSRSRLSEMSERKLQMGKVNFIKKRSQQLQTLTHRKNKNKNLLQKLKSQTQRISKYRSKAQRQIQNYRVILGVQEPSKNASRVSSHRTTTKSFYVTAS